MDIENLISQIIPPADYFHRNGFSNEDIIDSLTEEEKLQVEDRLIQMLENSDDNFIADTLAYMKSYKAIPSLLRLLDRTSTPQQKIVVAACIYRISHSEKMVKVVIHEFHMINDKLAKIGAFSWLQKFHQPATDKILEEYSQDEDLTVAYVAKELLKRNR